jgi:hypothetical protein
MRLQEYIASHGLKKTWQCLLKQLAIAANSWISAVKRSAGTWEKLRWLRLLPMRLDTDP